MNQEGWGIRDMLLFLAIVCIAILVSMALYKKTFTQLFDNSGSITDFSNETYDSIENQLEKTAHTYTDNYYYKVLENGDEGEVTIRDMQAENLLTVVKDIKDDSIICSGYVHFQKQGGITDYKTYLKCGDNYKTDGYQSKLDEPVKQK